MFATLHAIDKLKKDKNDIRILNVGGLSVLPETLDTEATLMDWIQRLPSLFKPTKKYTMKDQTTNLMHLSGH